jgi:protein MpaA
MMSFEFQNHRIHDYNFLIRRWKVLARRAGLLFEAYAAAEEYDLYYLRSPALQSSGGIYLSAGIHGDEAASTEGLYQWANLYGSILRKLPVIIFPCLNPWGLVHNRRTDSENRDLNRSFHLDELPRIRNHKKILDGLSFKFALCLHEDYDAQGVYLYEIRKRLTPFGQELLAAAGYYVPIDLRTPESLYLSREHSERNITLETPSEYDLALRVQAQIAVIQKAIDLLFI